MLASPTMQDTLPFCFAPYFAMKKPTFRSFIYSIPTFMVCHIIGELYLYLYVTDTIKTFSTLQLGLFSSWWRDVFDLLVYVMPAKGLLWKWYAFGLADLMFHFSSVDVLLPSRCYCSVVSCPIVDVHALCISDEI